MISPEAQAEQSEAIQIRLILDGNVGAFCDLVTPHRRGLYLKALAIVRSEADAEEVAQNAVLKAFNKLSQFRHDSQFRTWLISITINEARMWLRANRKIKHESLDHQDGDGQPLRAEIVDPRENPLQVWERKKIPTGVPQAPHEIVDPKAPADAYAAPPRSVPGQPMLRTKWRASIDTYSRDTWSGGTGVCPRARRTHSSVGVRTRRCESQAHLLTAQARIRND